MNLTIKTKLIALATASLLLLSAIFTVETLITEQTVLATEKENVGIAVRNTLEENLKGQVDNIELSADLFYQQASLDSIKQDLATEIKVIYNTIDKIYQNSDSPALAQQDINAFLNHFVWGKSRYVFGYDSDSIDYRAHSLKHSLIGQPARDAQDKNGVYYARNIVEAAKRNHIGFSQYAFLNPATNKVENKISASIWFKPLNIVIATGEYITTLQADKQQNALTAINKARFGKNGYFWIQDSKGVILSHPKQSLIGTSIGNTEKVAREIANKDDAFVNMAFNNPATQKTENKIAYARHIFPEWGWIIATGAYETDITNAQNQLTQATQEIFTEKTRQNIISLLVVSTLAIAVFIWFINKIVDRLATLNQRIASLSSGEADLTSRLALAGKDEITDIASSVNQFIAYLQKMLQELANSSAHITVNVNRLSEQSEYNHHALNQHARETEQAVTAITEMSATANSVAESATQSAHNTNAAEQTANEAQQLVQSTTSSVSQLMSQIEQAALSINTMNGNTQEIVNVLAVIGEIAEQTNLLALNAAIEAARAGEQGRGFAVVADEVRALASRTQTSTAEINQILTKVQTDADSAVNAMQATQTSCQVASENTERVSASLTEMTAAIADINDLNSQIATAAEQQSVVTEEVSQNMNNIQAVVTDLSSSGETTLTSSQELAAANQQLTGLMQQFKV